jgi:hypothetical protein
MVSMSLALAGGIAIGSPSLITYNFNDQRGLLDLLLFILVLVLLLVSGRRQGLAEGHRRWLLAPDLTDTRRAPGARWVRSLPASASGLALVALIPLVLLDLPSERDGWSRAALRADRTVAHRAHGVGRSASLGQFASSVWAA